MDGNRVHRFLVDFFLTRSWRSKDKALVIGTFSIVTVRKHICFRSLIASQRFARQFVHQARKSPPKWDTC